MGIPSCFLSDPKEGSTIGAHMERVGGVGVIMQAIIIFMVSIGKGYMYIFVFNTRYRAFYLKERGSSFEPRANVQTGLRHGSPVSRGARNVWKISFL